MSFDPVRLELIKNAMGSVVDEMVLTLMRIAYSSILKDSMDVSSAFCDRQGRMIAQGLSLPLHLGAVPDAMEEVMRAFPEGLDPGDVVILNDPYHGGAHLPDIFMFQPTYVGDYLLGYGVMVAHQNDIGGRVPGSSAADSAEIFEEGLRIPPLKLHERGRPNETLFKIIALNVRTPETVNGDLRAQLAGCRICELGMQALAERYGTKTLEHYFEEMLDYSERAARRLIAAIPDGEYRFTDYLDDNGVQMDEPVAICAAVRVEDDTLTVDFAGTAPQVRGAINATPSFTKSSVYFAVRALMEDDVPNNLGFARAIRVVIPEGSLLNPRPPAAVAARGVSGFRVIDTVFGALAQAVPDRVRAAGEGGTTSYSIAGTDRNECYFQFREVVMGGWGGGARHDGIDGVANPAANLSNAPVEIVENQAPVRVERYEFVSDTGGAGRHRGGLAIRRQLRFLGDRGIIQFRSDRRSHLPYGLMGGFPGTPSENRLGKNGEWSPLPTKFVRHLDHGDVISHVNPGAGGYGDPFERDPQKVLADVRNGKVSAEAAERDYGVRVVDRPWRVDEAATRTLRRSR
jgi:N-methylhydantoinase B